MDFKKLAISTLVGGLVFFFTGGIFYGLLLADFFQSQLGPIQGLNREEPILWALVLGNLFSGLLLSLIFSRWAGIKTAVSGAKAGAIICFLMALSYDLVFYSMTNMTTLIATLVDPFVFALMGALAGAAIGWILGRGEIAG
ncbi:MAG: hypothetical protein R3E32_06900 [Chitinophagales bacterium]